MRAQIVHNDFNPYNILVEDKNHDVVAGVIDFGDCVHTQLINDLAIACAYHLEGAPQPLDFAAELAGAYHAILPLKPAEIDILFDLIAVRLVMGVCINGWRAALYPENAAYILSNNTKAWAGLERFASLPRQQAQKVLRAACGME
jgi:Ser/Thr protein kinase RdoA (MazF antagonist)